MPMADDIQTDGGHRSVACFKRPMSLRQRVESSQGGSIWDTDTLEQKEDGVHEEGCLVVYRPRHNARDPIVECRDKSTSAWLHFPHVELVFLLFAFEGFVAAQVSAARNAECLPVFITASTVLVGLNGRSVNLTGRYSSTYICAYPDNDENAMVYTQSVVLVGSKIALRPGHPLYIKCQFLFCDCPLAFLLYTSPLLPCRCCTQCSCSWAFAERR